MSLRGSFSSKIFAVMLAIAVGAALLSNLLFYHLVESELVTSLGTEAKAFAIEAAEALQTEIPNYRKLLDGSITPQQAEPLIETPLRRMQLHLGPMGVENIYTLALFNERLFVVGDPDPTGGLPLSAPDTANLDVKLKTLFNKLPQISPPYSDAYGTWVSGYAPMLEEGGEALAIVGVDLPLGSLPVINRVLRENILLNLLVALLVAVLAGYWASRRISRPLERLAAGLEQIGAGDFDTALIADAEDEFGRVSEAFNRMAGGLQDKQRMDRLLRQSVSPEIAEALLQDRVAPEGALVEGTVLFADIRGFTALSETLPAREVITLVNDYLEALVPPVLAHGGVIDKFVGDEIMALFGVPECQPDDAGAAVQAALAMQAILGELNASRRNRNKPTAEMGIGINTGALIAGSVGTQARRNYTVLGAAVNLGARLCSLAKPGQILINHTTYLRIADRIDASEMAPVTVKGIRFPLRVFQVN